MIGASDFIFSPDSCRWRERSAEESVLLTSTPDSGPFCCEGGGEGGGFKKGECAREASSCGLVQPPKSRGEDPSRDDMLIVNLYTTQARFLQLFCTVLELKPLHFGCIYVFVPTGLVDHEREPAHPWIECCFESRSEWGGVSKAVVRN